MRRGPEWMGETNLPDRWEITPVKRVGAVTLGKMLQSESKGEDASAPYLRAANVQPDGVLAISDSKRMWFTRAERVALELRAGDVVVVEGGIGGYGRAAYVPDNRLEGWGFQNSINRIRPAGLADGRFIAYVLQAVRNLGFIEVYCNIVSMPHFTADKLGSLPIPVPPLDEQRSISDLLDRETAQIDALVAKQEEFIAFLRERRSGIIASAVTGGQVAVGDHAEGARWLGATPPGWLRGQVKHFGSVTLGKMLQSEDKGADVLAPYMRAANVQPDGVLALEDVKSMWFGTRELRSLSLRKGDVVVVEGGIGGYGRAAFVSETLDGWGFQNSINRIRPHEGNDGRYMAYFLIMARQKGFITAYCNIVSMPHLTAEKLAAMPMLLPPAAEQRSIADQIDEQTSVIDGLIAKAQEHITLAKERRAALITAAVTGQFDVRTAQKAG